MPLTEENHHLRDKDFYINISISNYRNQNNDFKAAP
jgi:hypothetical protein